MGFGIHFVAYWFKLSIGISLIIIVGFVNIVSPLNWWNDLLITLYSGGIRMLVHY